MERHGYLGCLDFSKPLDTRLIPPRKKKGAQSKSNDKDKKGPEPKNPPPNPDVATSDDEQKE